MYSGFNFFLFVFSFTICLIFLSVHQFCVCLHACIRHSIWICLTHYYFTIMILWIFLLDFSCCLFSIYYAVHSMLFLRRFIIVNGFLQEFNEINSCRRNKKKDYVIIFIFLLSLFPSSAHIISRISIYMSAFFKHFFTTFYDAHFGKKRTFHRFNFRN